MNRTTPEKSKWATRIQRTHTIRNNVVDRIFNSQQLAKAGKTPYDVVHSNGIMSLRYYSSNTVATDAVQYRVPLVIVPPLAVNMLIYDLFPERSLVNYLTAQGFHVYLIDWGEPTLKHTDYDLSTYVAQLLPEFLGQVRRHSGEQELSLHGWSLGGAFALIYTALFDDQNIRNLVILGAPIDTHQSGYMGQFYQFLHRRSLWVRRHTTFRLHRLPSRLFHVSGMSNTLGFKFTDPIGNLAGYWQLLSRLDDREYVINHATSSAFIDRMLAYPGGVMRDVILKFWIDNELATGKIRLGHRTADIADIQSALIVFGGSNDNIVTENAVKPLLDLVGSTDKAFALVPGGHMGIVSGSKAPEFVWKKTTEWLSPRSH
jgi:polyhydroxyalkanoate synthase